MTARLLIHRLRPDAVLPRRVHPGDAGFDLCSVEECSIAAGERAAVGTGLALALPPGYVGLVHPRSGLALQHGISVANAPGTIDAGYRGEVRVILVNLGGEAWQCLVGDRIAQLIIMRIPDVDIIEVDGLPGTHRGAGGFGSTGRAAPIG